MFASLVFIFPTNVTSLWPVISTTKYDSTCALMLRGLKAISCSPNFMANLASRHDFPIFRNGTFVRTSIVYVKKYFLSHLVAFTKYNANFSIS